MIMPTRGLRRSRVLDQASGGALRHAAGQSPMKPRGDGPSPGPFPPAIPPFDARQATRAVRGLAGRRRPPGGGGGLKTRRPVSPAPRSRTLGQRTATGPMPVWISRSGKCPWRTIRRRPAEPVRCAYASTKPATSASTACPSKRRAPRRKTSVSGSSSNDPGWRSWTTVSSLMAYPSFVENGDSNIARIRRPHLIPSPIFGYSSLQDLSHIVLGRGVVGGCRANRRRGAGRRITTSLASTASLASRPGKKRHCLQHRRCCMAATPTAAGAL